MNCYYQLDDGPWFKGHMYSQRGSTEIVFGRPEPSGGFEELVLWKPEFLFNGTTLRVTGLRTAGSSPLGNTFRLQSVDVRFSKPREKT